MWHDITWYVNIIAHTTKNGSHDMKQADSSITIVRNVCVLTSASMIVYVFVTRSWSAWKFNLEYGGTSTKLSMQDSSRKMFPTIWNLQIRVHVYCPRHCCGELLTFGCFFPNDRITFMNVIWHTLVCKYNCTHKKKWFTRHETGRFLNNHCQECVRAYLSFRRFKCVFFSLSKYA
jgi:hypothetical protein